ncbi:hypothetical protein AB0K40_32660 [Nonomuraea bangladeshensis]|uniref:Fibrinogen C-terminal domain-containing protein n=1 Tax=Nonomuraea bangladeshensis TaxID=404385 RepID=A0ABV3HCZ6_9ACTN
MSVEERADGTKAITAGLSGDYFYYWGGFWYEDCSSDCHMNGHFALKDPTGATSYSHYLTKMWSGSRNGSLTHTFEASSGHYEISFIGKKYGGYWRDQRRRSTDLRDEMFLHFDHIKIDVP